jgi:S-DNA-T family DNA segregation ATPase FtsK/SpoIIIE
VDERKKSEVMAFAWFALSILLLVSLVTYTRDDIAYEVSTPNSPVKNFVGPFGAYAAWALRILFGKTSYFLVPVFLLWSLAKWSGKKGQKVWLRFFSVVIFLTSACALFSLVGASVPALRFDNGGIIGYFTSVFLTNVFGHAGMFVALSLFLLSVILATELLVLQIAAELFNRVKPGLTGQLSEDTDDIKKAPRVVGKSKDILKKPVVPIKEKLASAKQQIVDTLKPAAPVKTEPVKPMIKLSNPKPEAPKPDKALPKEPQKVLEYAANAEEGNYRLPSLDLLNTAPPFDQTKAQFDIEESSRILEATLQDFGIEAKVVEVEQGPTITRYELQPAAGVKVQRITSLENDIALAMSATSVRIVAPIPGKSRVGIEVPNQTMAVVSLKEVLESREFQSERSPVAIAIGKDTAGAPMVMDLASMPHLLIAGATNTGKSVCINSIIMSMLFRSSPDQLKFLIVDPKMVELHFYNDLPHLICPVITDKAKVPGSLGWLLGEMERRYKVLSRVGAKNIIGFNEKVEKKQITPESLKPMAEGEENHEPILVKKMPYIVLVIDELADLMMASANEIEGSIARLAQLARAVGIHMILATQRPSVDVITGIIKANFPARIAFQVASKVDSRTILDENGADKLLGRGDLLIMDPRKSKVIRAQGALVQDSEIEKVTSFIKKQNVPIHHESVTQEGQKKMAMGDFKKDEIYEEAKRVILETGQASVSMVQRRLGVGYTRAARLIDMMEEEGIVGPYRGAKPREILVERPSSAPVNTGQESAENS